jgi:hypothetical protein
MVEQVSVIGAANGLLLVQEPQNVGIESTSTTTNTVAAGIKQLAFHSAGEAIWSFDHCDAMSDGGTLTDYVPDDVHVTSKVTATPALGGCLVYLPSGSVLKEAGTGAQDVGANVIYRYGDDDQLSLTRLWDGTTGAFPCGAVAPGVNDDPMTSCVGVHQRVHVGTADCPLP